MSLSYGRRADGTLARESSQSGTIWISLVSIVRERP